MRGEVSFLVTAFVGYFMASSLCLGQFLWRHPVLEKWKNYSVGVAWLGHSIALLIRLQSSAAFIGVNMYEFGLAFVWCLVGGYGILQYRYQRRELGVFVLPLAFLLTGLFAGFYQESKPLMPALKSNWLAAHVLSAMVAYAALGVASGLAAIYLWKGETGGNVASGGLAVRLPATILLETLAHRLIVLAMPFLTLVIITGAVWAEAAWGTYWRWDPKETWSLVTWLVYAVYLHGRSYLGWRGRAAMQWVVAGFGVVLFTFIGVNLLLPGLHSYAR